MILPDPEVTRMLHRIRELFYKHGVRRVSLDAICQDLGISRKELNRMFRTKHDMVKQLLELERQNFEVIFEKHNFDGVNSIDVLLIVSKEISDNFMNISPLMTFDLQKYYTQI